LGLAHNGKVGVENIISAPTKSPYGIKSALILFFKTRKE
jgi:hypothetical protein